jgi:hypothetical protein
MFASSDSPSPSSITPTSTSTSTSNEVHSVAKSRNSTPSAESISTPIPNEYSVEKSNKDDKPSIDALNPFKYELFVKIAVIALCLWKRDEKKDREDTDPIITIITENETFKIVCEVLKKYNINVNENLFSYVFLALVFVCIDDNSLEISLKEFHAMVPGLKLEETGLVHFLHEFSKHVFDEIIKQALQRRQASLNLQSATASSKTAQLGDKSGARVRPSIRNAPRFRPGRGVFPGGGSRKTYRKLKRSKRFKSNKRTLNFKFKSNKRTNKTSKRYYQTGGTAKEVLNKLFLKIFPDKSKRGPLLNSLIMCFMTVLLLWSAFSLFNNLSKLISPLTSTSFNSEEERATGNAVRELSDQQLQVFGPHAQEFVGLVGGSLLAILDSEISVTIGNVLAKLFGMGGQSFKADLQHLTGLISEPKFNSLVNHLELSFQLTRDGVSAGFANTPRRTGDGVFSVFDNKVGDFTYNLLNTQQISNTALQLAVADNQEAIRRMLEDLKQMLEIRLKRFTTEKRRALYGFCVALMMLGVSSREIYQWVMLSLELKARQKERGSLGKYFINNAQRSNSPPPAADQSKHTKTLPAHMDKWPTKPNEPSTPARNLEMQPTTTNPVNNGRAASPRPLLQNR